MKKYSHNTVNDIPYYNTVLTIHYIFIKIMNWPWSDHICKLKSLKIKIMAGIIHWTQDQHKGDWRLICETYTRISARWNDNCLNLQIPWLSGLQLVLMVHESRAHSMSLWALIAYDVYIFTYISLWYVGVRLNDFVFQTVSRSRKNQENAKIDQKPFKLSINSLTPEKQTIPQDHLIINSTYYITRYITCKIHHWIPDD